MTMQEAVIKNIDTDYSYQLAKRMEQFRSNEKLGYRPAGSKAEFLTGEMLKDEMQKLGLSDVCKNAVTVDGWEFENAELTFETKEGKRHTALLGAYQTDFVTDGEQAFSLMYLGKGTAADYEGKDVTGKLVLVDINQRDEWWINYPVYQAYLKGAVGLIAVQMQGYGEVDDEALNAQDIAGPEYAPAFSISRRDAALLKDRLCENERSVRVELDACSRVERNRPAYNITGKIPGTETDQMILLSAHYDSYFDGFQDDNCAVSMTFGIAKALLESGYRPRHTIVICALAAEEWGVCDSKYDWSTGAWNQVFRIHPEWQGKVLADLNFELPAHAHSSRDAIRCTYEYADFLKKFADEMIVPEDAYPDGLTVLAPIETWSDDFSMAIAGIPSTVNDFSAGPFMETHYHSQYDNEEIYQENVYRFHHELYTRLLLKLDALVFPPLDFSRLFREMHSSVSARMAEQDEEHLQGEMQTLIRETEQAEQTAEELYEWIEKSQIVRPVDAKSREDISQRLLGIFRKGQDYFVRLNWQDEVLFPHEAASNNICYLNQAVQALEEGEIEEALKALYEVDNNCYAFLFDEEVYYHFTEYILHQPKDRLMWGAGRILHHENLYGIVKRLRKLESWQAEHGQLPDLEEEIRRLQAAQRRQRAYLTDDIRYMTESVRKMQKMMEDSLQEIKD